MEADQSFEEDDDEDDEEEEEDVRTSKKRPASSPAVKSQVCFQISPEMQLIIFSWSISLLIYFHD